MDDISAIIAVILAKAEVTYGTDPVPDGATDAMLVKNLTIRPLVQRLTDRGNLVLKHFGSRGRRVFANYSTIEFDIELAGSGTAGTEPPYAPVLKAAAVAVTTVALTSNTYKPITKSLPSVTFYAYLDGLLHKLVGCRGSAELRMPIGDAPHIHVSMIGLYTAVADEAMPGTVTLTGFQKPVVVSKANTTPMSLHGHAGVFADFTLNFGNEVDYYNLVNQEDVKIVDRKASGSIELKAVLVATKDFWTIAKNETLGALSIVHGATAGNIVTIAAANVQLTEPEYTERNKVRYSRIPLDFLPSSAGNDDWSIAFT